MNAEKRRCVQKIIPRPRKVFCFEHLPLFLLAPPLTLVYNTFLESTDLEGYNDRSVENRAGHDA